jgi:hypothetical protein
MLSKAQNGSIVDYLKGVPKKSSFASRKELAKDMGIKNYKGTAKQNIQLLENLRASKPASGATASRITTSDTTNLPFIQYGIRVARDSGNTNTSAIYLSQSFESVNSVPFIGKQVTVSAYIRKGSNLTNASSFTLTLQSGTGTDQNMYSGFTGSASVASGTPTLTTSWQRFTFTGTVSTSATQLGVWAFWTPSGTADANDYFEISGVQVDVGAVALPFRTYAATIQGELAACQRYYIRWKSEDGSTNNPTFNLGQMVSTGAFRFVLPFPTAMRVKPSAVEYSGFRLNSGATQYTSGAITIDQSNTLNTQLNVAITSGPAAGTAGWLIPGSSSATDYIGLTAEL